MRCIQKRWLNQELTQSLIGTVLPLRMTTKSKIINLHTPVQDMLTPEEKKLVDLLADIFSDYVIRTAHEQEKSHSERSLCKVES
jgi:DNA replication initiation complex subunit (GINS family)